MGVTRSIAVTFMIGFFLNSGISVQVQAADMFIDVGGTVRDNDSHPDGGNSNRVVLAASGAPVTYGNATIGTIEISALQAGTPAILERVIDGSIDMFALHNVKIKRVTGPVTNFPITFWGTAAVQPATPPGYYYTLEANGLWGADNNKPVSSSFTFKTHIRLLGGNWTQYQSWTKSISCTNSPPLPCILSFSSGVKQSSSAYYPGTNLRDLKGALTIKLSTNNDTLNFNNGTGARASSGAQLDCDFTDSIANLFRDDPGNCVFDE